MGDATVYGSTITGTPNGYTVNALSAGVVSGTILATADANILAEGSITGPITAGGNANVTTLADITQTVTATAGNLSLTDYGELDGNASATGSATLFVAGQVQGNVTAATGDVSLTAMSPIQGAVTATAGSATVTAVGSGATLAGKISAGLDAAVTGFGDLTSGVTAGRNATVSVLGKVTGNNTIAAGGAATVWSAGDLTATVTAGTSDANVAGGGTTQITASSTSGSVAVSSLGPLTVTATATAANNSLQSVQIAGFNTIVLNQVAAGGDVSVQGTGAVSGAATSNFGGASVFAGGTFSGAITAAQASAVMALGSVTASVVSSTSGSAAVYAWGGGGGITVSGSQGATLLSYTDLSSATVSSTAGPAMVFGGGNVANAVVTAGGDAEIAALGNLVSSCRATGYDVSLFAGGNLAGTATSTAGTVNTLSFGATNGLSVTSAGDAQVVALGALTATSVSAGHDLWAASYGDMNAASGTVTLNATHDIQTVWTMGSLAASITAGNQVDNVMCYGAIGSTDAISAANGPVVSVAGWGAIAGQISAGTAIQMVHSGSNVTATLTAPTHGTPIANDPSFEGDVPVIPSHALSPSRAWLNGQYNQLLQAEAAASAAGATLALANAAIVAGMNQNLPTAASVASAGTAALDAAFAQFGNQIQGDLQVQGYVKGRAFASACDSYQDALAGAALALAGAKRAALDLQHQGAVTMQVGLAQSTAANKALTAEAAQMMSGKGSDFTALTAQLTAKTGQRPVEWRKAANDLVYKAVKDVLLETAKDWLNTAALVLPFTPLAPLTPAVMAASASISVVQGNYWEALFTVVCILPMMKGPGAKAAESVAGEEAGNMARSESVAMADCAEGFGEKAAGNIAPRMAAKCGSSAVCFVAGTPVLVPEAEDGPALEKPDAPSDAYRGWGVAGIVMVVGIFGWYADEKRAARRMKKASVGKVAGVAKSRADDGWDDVIDEAVGDLEGLGMENHDAETTDDNAWRSASLRGVESCGLLVESGDACTATALIEEPEAGAMVPRRRRQEENNKGDSTPSRGLRLGRLWLAVCLILAVFLAGGRPSHEAPSKSSQHLSATAQRNVPANRPIEAIRVGQRVITNSGADVLQTAVDVKTWRLLRLHAEDRWPDGTLDTIEIETLQSPEWVAEQKAQVGATVEIPLDLEEMGLPADFEARVVGNESCPPIAKGPGRVVLTTVNHLNSYVLQLTVADEHGRQEEIRPTGFHKFFSADRQSWVSAEELRPGEQLSGVESPLRVVSVAWLPGVHRVYNMTVEDEHVYRVSTLGALVHNLCADKLKKAMNAAGMYGDEGAIPHHMVSRIDSRALQARQILAKHNINLDSHWNGVFLPPNVGTAGRGALHEFLHTNKYYRELTIRLTAADANGKASVLRALQQIRSDLVANLFPF